MRLSAKTDLEAPAAYVYAKLADHAAWEREAVERGVEVERPANMPMSGVGAGWQLRFMFRGRVRNLLLRMDEMTVDQKLALSFEGHAFTGNSVLEVLSLSPRRTRLHVTVEVKPKTLAARLFLNTLRLAKRRVQNRFEARLGALGGKIQNSYALGKGRSERV